MAKIFTNFCSKYLFSPLGDVLFLTWKPLRLFELCIVFIVSVLFTACICYFSYPVYCDYYDILGSEIIFIRLPNWFIFR